MSRPDGGGRSGRRLSALGVAVVMAAWALLCTPLRAQDALVLSGGGSRGLAHAGAIRGFEKRRFRPDIIVGASMGAIIGALYSAGSATCPWRWRAAAAPVCIVAVDVLRPAPAIESTAPLAVALRGYRELLVHTLDDEPPPDLLVLPRIPPTSPIRCFP